MTLSLHTHQSGILFAILEFLIQLLISFHIVSKTLQTIDLKLNSLQLMEVNFIYA